MSTDGADIGVSPTRALDTIIGGKESPGKMEQASRAEMLEKIMSMPDEYEKLVKGDGAEGYDNVCFWLAKQFYLLRKSGIQGDSFSLYREMKKKCGENGYGCTGFMVGYANNLSLWLLDYQPQENPAIMEIG